MIEETYSFVDSLTGHRKLTVRPAAGGWRSKVNAVDSPRTNTLLARERGHLLISRNMWAELLQPWRTRFVVEWNGVVKYAGWVLGHDWDSATGRLEVKHADFRAIAARRALFGIGPVDLPDIVIAGRSLRGLMGEYAWYALINGGYRWALRLVIDDADRFETGPFTETIQRHRLDTLESLLRDVQTRDGGPELHFYPRWGADGALEDVLRIGNPTLTSNLIEVNGAAPKTPLTGFGYTLDAEEQRTGVWGIAQGRGDDGIIGLARDVPGSEIPILDASHDIKDTTDQAVADSQAMGILRQNREPIKQYRFQLADPDLAAQAEIGTRLRVYYPGDELQPRGWIEGRVIALSHNVGSRSPVLEVQ